MLLFKRRSATEAQLQTTDKRQQVTTPRSGCGAHAHTRSVVSDSVTPWTVACQAPLSMGFSRQESWSGLPFPPPVDLPNPGPKPRSPALAGRFFTTEPPGKFILDAGNCFATKLSRILIA